MQNKKEITIVDIAKKLGLSLSTVSRALSDHPYVKDETRKLVQEAAEELGYRRNVFASNLRQNSTRSIGLIVPRVSMYFHAAVITEIQNQLFKKGYSLVITQSNDDVAMEKKLVETLYDARMDAVIAATSLHTVNADHFRLLLDNNIPVIFYDRIPDNKYAAYTVSGNDYMGGYMATTHLIERGCRRIAHISGPITCNLYRDRAAGYKAALAESGIGYLPSLLVNHELTPNNAMCTLNALFKRKPYPDAVFAANDVTAIAVLDFARQKGIDIPRELKVVGYSNDPRSAIITPSITTIEQYPELMGQTIVSTLMGLLAPKDTKNSLVKPVVNEIVEVNLIKRQSSN